MKPVKTIIALLQTVAVIFISGCSEPEKPPLTLRETFPGPWQYERDPGIELTLLNKGINYCEDYKYQESKEHSGEYLVYCLKDGNEKGWLAILMWPNIKSALEPTAPDPTIPE